MQTVSKMPGPETKEFVCVEQLRAFVLECASSGRGILAGSPCALPAAARQKVEYFIQTPQATAVLEHSVPDQVISIESGTLISDLLAKLQATKQWFPIPEAFGSLTLMELIDRGLAGSFEHCFGGLRELILGADVLLSTGEVIKCGGKVVKNVSGYDLTKMLIGARGSFGYVLSAHLRLFALPEEFRTACYKFNDLSSARTAGTRVLRAGLPLSSVQLINSDAVRDLLPPGKNEPGGIMLCVQIHGQHKLLEELESAMSGIINAAAPSGTRSDPVDNQKQEPADLQGQAQAELWKRLNEPCAADENVMVIQGETRFLCQLAEEVFANLPWTLRPGAGKLIVRPLQGGNDDLLKKVREACIASGTTAVVAAGDNELLWRVSYLPEDDAVRRKIADRLKQEFDPSGVFSPLVSL